MSLLSWLSGCVSVSAVLGSAVTALWLRPLSPSLLQSASGRRRPAGLEAEQTQRHTVSLSISG